jgi:hypothetical protein
LPSSLSAHPSVSTPALGAFQLHPTPFNSTPTFDCIERPSNTFDDGADLRRRDAPVSQRDADADADAADSRWPALGETSWEFTEPGVMGRGGALGPLLAPPWRVMLLSDGSVTRHLQLLTDGKVSAEAETPVPVRPYHTGSHTTASAW